MTNQLHGTADEAEREAAKRVWLVAFLRDCANDVEQCGGRLVRSAISAAGDGTEYELVYRIYKDGEDGG